MPQAPSTRWCPTPEQLMILEEMYRSGIRTPNAAQIQQITAHLAYYGKIEGKNVFYWFQNHKARDRQKLRRRLTRHQQLLHLQQQQQLLNPATTAAVIAAAGGAAAGLPHHLPYQSLQANEFTHHLSVPSLLQHHHPQQLSFPTSHQQLPAIQQQGAYQRDACSPSVMNLVGKLEACGREGVHLQPERLPLAMMTVAPANPALMSYGDHHQPWLAAVTDQSPCCRAPLKTLDLFPTKSTRALRDECIGAAAGSKSSSCSTSTTN